MSANIYTKLTEFIEKHENCRLENNSHVTSERISNILTRLIVQQFHEASATFGNDYFREIIHQIGETILNVVYRKKQIYINVEHLVAYISTIQFILHAKKIELPESIIIKLEKYLHSFVVMQNLLKIRMIYQDLPNSNIVSNFYKNVYLNAYEFRYRTLLKEFGIFEKSGFLALLLLQELVEKNELNIEVYESNVTAEWIILSLIYYILAAKYQPKQIPVLSKILQRYNSRRVEEQCHREINGNELCHFYNNIILEKIRKVEPYEVDKMIDEAQIDSEIISNLIGTEEYIQFALSKVKITLYLITLSSPPHGNLESCLDFIVQQDVQMN